MQEEYRYSPEEGSKRVADFAERAIKAFQADAPEQFQQLVKEYEGHSAVIGLFGVGSTSVSVRGGKVSVANTNGKGKSKTGAITARAATYPETVVAIAEGRITPLEAFHVGDLVVRTESDELHRAFGLMVQMTDSALRSTKMQDVLADFRKRMDLRQERRANDE